MQFVLASHNKKKLAELQDILGQLGLQIIALPSDAPEPIEDGDTFEQNALIKARSASKLTGLPAIADDSGLQVDAFHGAPGIFSARYGSAEYCQRYGAIMGAPLPPDASDEMRTKLLLNAMKDVSHEKRDAAFVSAIACVFPDGREFTARGQCTGTITYEIQGQGGFGYDPVFYVPQYDATFAQLSQEIKNKISHRADALKKFVHTLKTYTGE